MPGIYSKHCIVMGDLDSYCLVCSTSLPRDHVLAHIRKPKHNANLKPIVYFEKYKDDFIKKVNGVYFCEVCNMTFSTSAKVGIHVTEETHMKGRRRQLTRVGTSIVFQKNILIEESAWNGLVEDTCVLCNVEFDDHSTHISEHSHVFNVIRSTVTIDDDNNIYRKIDGGYQCLKCNKVVSDTAISTHFNSEQHNTAFIKYDNSKNDENNIDEGTEEKREERKENETNGGHTKETPNDNIDIKVLTDNPSDTDGKAIKKSTITEELESYANKHGLSVNPDTYNLYCQICSSELPATMNNVKEHIAGKKHTANSKQSEAKKLNTKKIEKIMSKDFCRRTVIVESRFGRHAIINDTFCIEYDHFFCLLDFGKIICQFCHIEMTPENIIMHLVSPSHANIIWNSFVITSLEDEFVRQVNSIYHCGFCGRVEKDFEDMLGHLATPEHKLEKAAKQKIFQCVKYEGLLNRSTAELTPFDLRPLNIN